MGFTAVISKWPIKGFNQSTACVAIVVAVRRKIRLIILNVSCTCMSQHYTLLYHNGELNYLTIYLTLASCHHIYSSGPQCIFAVHEWCETLTFQFSLTQIAMLHSYLFNLHQPIQMCWLLQMHLKMKLISGDFHVEMSCPSAIGNVLYQSKPPY